MQIFDDADARLAQMTSSYNYKQRLPENHGLSEKLVKPAYNAFCYKSYRENNVFKNACLVVEVVSCVFCCVFHRPCWSHTLKVGFLLDSVVAMHIPVHTTSLQYSGYCPKNLKFSQLF